MVEIKNKIFNKNLPLSLENSHTFFPASNNGEKRASFSSSSPSPITSSGWVRSLRDVIKGTNAYTILQRTGQRSTRASVVWRFQGKRCGIVDFANFSSDLSLSCSFSPLKSEESVGEESVDAFGTVEPYAYEPVVQCLALLITNAFMVSL